MLKIFLISILILCLQAENNTGVFDKCPQFGPYCNCYTSPIVIVCDNFDSFSQLNFSKGAGNDTIIYELELAPLKPLTLDSLDLSGIEITGQVTLRNIAKFSLLTNPFESARKDNKLRLNLYESTLEFELNGANLKEDCAVNSVDSDLLPLFSSFDYIEFGRNMNYSSDLCPLVFKGANIRVMEMNSLKSNGFKFRSLNKFTTDPYDPLKINVEYLKIYDSSNLVLDEKFFDEDVFYKTAHIEIDNSNLETITDSTFGDLYNLRKLTLNIENFEEFLIKSKNSNKWMSKLNSDISIDLSNEVEIQENLNYTFLIIFNNRIKDQNYLYPDEDLDLFKNFPHEKVIFNY